ncbi:Dachshund 1 [Hymenolepis weldensis]
MQVSPSVSNTIVNNNQVHILEYRGAQLAAFNVEGRGLLICLPQAFELFLKQFVGGLHTVYTKLKRLDIQPVVCNVEQVRILRGLGAIQPGVNRCKLIAPREFDILYADCTTSRIGIQKKICKDYS